MWAGHQTIMEALEEDDPELARNPEADVCLEDIVNLDDRAIQLIIREVESRDLALALKIASEEVSDRIYRNMSKRAASLLKEDIDYMGPVRLRDIEEAQSRIVAVVRRLEEAGDLVISRGGEDELIV